jgi:hypothetical protein
MNFFVVLIVFVVKRADTRPAPTKKDGTNETRIQTKLSLLLFQHRY